MMVRSGLALNVVTSIVGFAAMAVGVALLVVHGAGPLAVPGLLYVAAGRALHLWRLP